MTGNSIGKLFCVTTFGESHGSAIGAIVDGCPPGLTLSAADIQVDLDRRRPGQNHLVTQRQEADQVEILSGVFEGKTTGTPIALLLKNQDAKSKDYSEIRDKFRPGHADFSYLVKYGVRDHRGGGRSSARETAARVAAGAIARLYLHQRLDLTVRACLTAVGKIRVSQIDWGLSNALNWPEAQTYAQVEDLIKTVRKQGNSIGAELYVEALGVPPGLGAPVFDRLDADIAKAIMSINAVKAVAIGDGFEVVSQLGSEHRDEMTEDGFCSNHAGGILGGISTGQTIRASLAIKPASSILLPGRTLDTQNKPCEIVTKGRHDPCVGVRAPVIVEAMVLLTLMDHYLSQLSLSASNLVEGT